MQTSVARRIVPLALALGAGCSGSGPGAGPLDPPSGLAVSDGATFDEVVLDWQLSPGAVGYVLEASFDGVTFQQLNETLIPSFETRVTLAFSPSTPELVQVWFRLQSRRGSASSAWSVATYFRGIRPPSISATATSLGLVTISWVDDSEVADMLLLERADAPANPETWTPLPVAFGATSYADADYPELGANTYRVRYGKGGIWSRAASVSSGPLPLHQPLDLRAEVTPAGVALSWTDRSALATGIAVHCTPCGGGATLAPTASGYLDPWAPPWPTARYWVEAFQEAPTLNGDPGPLPVAELAPFRIAGPAATLDARTFSLPGSPLLGDPLGDNAYATSSASSGYEAVRSHGGIEDRQVLPFRAWVPPGMLLDGAGNPHVVTRTDADATGLLVLSHFWHDGNGWHGEEIGPIQVFSTAIGFALDAGGKLELVLELAHVQADGTLSLSVMRGARPGDTWSWAPVPGLTGFIDFAVAADGTEYVLSGPAIATLAPGGTWSLDQVPPGGPGFASVVAGPGGQVGIVGADGAMGLVWTLLYLERSGGAWSAPETIGAIAAGSSYSRASSPDGARVHVAATFLDGAVPWGKRLDLFTRVGGAWAGMPLAPTGGSAALGYTADGKLWIAGGGSLWREP